MAWRGEAQSTDCSNVLCCTVASVKWVWSTALPGDRDPTQVRKYFLTCKGLKKSLHNVFKTKLVILFAYIPEIPKCGLTQAFKSHSLLRWNPALQISVPKFEKLLRSENWLLQLISVHFLATASTSGKAPFLSSCLRNHGCHDVFRKKEDRLMALTSPDFSTWVGEYIGNVRAAELKQVTWVAWSEMRAGAFPLPLTSLVSQDSAPGSLNLKGSFAFYCNRGRFKPWASAVPTVQHQARTCQLYQSGF